MSLAAQTGVLLEIALRGLVQRWFRALLAVLGTVSVVAVLTSVLSISQGYDRVVRTTASAGSVRVLMQGALAEIASSISGDEVALIRKSPLVARDAQGAPLLSAELYTSVKLPSRVAGKTMNFSLRGVEPAAFALSGTRLLRGRAPQSGRREVIIGKLAADRIAGGAIGSSLRIANSLWQVVGVFTSDSGLAESELWVDAGALATTLDRGSSVQTLSLRLVPGATVAALQEALDNDPRIRVRAIDQAAYLADQSASLRSFVDKIGYGITILMSAGAAFAALGTSYASVTSRIREIGTYQALGFRRVAVVGSIVAESLVLTLLGGALGALAALLIFDGVQTSTVLLSANYTQIGFAFDVSSGILVQAAVLAVAIGLAGSLYPVLLVLKLPISTACGERR